MIKKQLLLLAVLLLFLTGCARFDAATVQLGLRESPYYHLGDAWWEHDGIEEYYFNQIPSELNEIYRELFERIRNGEDEAQLYATVPTEQFWTAYYSVLADHPEFFWVGPDIEVNETALTGKVVSYRMGVTVPQSERESMKALIEAAADECIAGISSEATDYEKIKYVYEYLINTTEYATDSADNQNVQSALVYHASVCAGYSRAFQYILHRMGMFCTYVSGSVPGGDHAWNIVRLYDPDGQAQYYHVDVTWGDPVFVGAEEGGPAPAAMNYTYLCCSDQELFRTHTVGTEVPMPACTDDSYDYYRRNGHYFETFDTQTVYDALMNSVWADQPLAELKFGDADAYETAKYEIFQNGLIGDAAQYLMQVYGTSSWSYSYHCDDTFRLITIYWRE